MIPRLWPAALLAAVAVATAAQVSSAASPSPSARGKRAGAVASPSPSPSPSSTPQPPTTPDPGADKRPVVLFLVDNSASLPPLDPHEERVAALEKLFIFLQGQRYRLILFGGRHEVWVDQLERYRSDGQWTDFYFALKAAGDLTKSYPPGTEFRIVLLTDAILDPSPKEWEDMGVPAGADLKAHVRGRIEELLREMKLPLYVVLIGVAPVEEQGSAGGERSPQLILDMVRAANGDRASPFAQTVASLMGDDGVLFRKFIYRVTPQEGLPRLAPVIKRIATPPSVAVEAKALTGAVVPLAVFLFLLLGALVRAFPGPGDVEVVEAEKNVPVHLVVDKKGAGLSRVADAREATATITWQAGQLELGGAGIDAASADGLSRDLLPLDLDALRRRLREIDASGTPDEKMQAQNLEYMAKNMTPEEAERLLTTPAAGRREISARDFVRAKAHLLSDEPLLRRLTEARASIVVYGAHGGKKDLKAGEPLSLGPYTYAVDAIEKGGRRDVRIVMRYVHVPSLFGLKSWVPERVQRVARLRRSDERLVS